MQNYEGNLSIVTLQHVIHRQLVWPEVVEFQMTVSLPVQYLKPYMQLNMVVLMEKGHGNLRLLLILMITLQIDLLHEYVICAVATLGNPPTQSPDAQEWTTDYKLRFSFSGNTFSPYEEIKTDKVGNRSFRTKDFSHKSFSTSFRPFAQFLVVISHNNHK